MCLMATDAKLIKDFNWKSCLEYLHSLLSLQDSAMNNWTIWHNIGLMCQSNPSVWDCDSWEYAERYWKEMRSTEKHCPAADQTTPRASSFLMYRIFLSEMVVHLAHVTSLTLDKRSVIVSHFTIISPELAWLTCLFFFSFVNYTCKYGPKHVEMSVCQDYW